MTKVAVVTGASSGIGFHLSKALLKNTEDTKVVAIGRRGDFLEQLRLSCPDRVMSIVADVSTIDGRNTICKKLSAYTQLDYLVHAAATVQPLSSINNLLLDDWRTSIFTNLEAPLFLTQALLEKFNHSKVLFFTSGPDLSPVQGAAAYCMSKAGQKMLYEIFKAEIPMEHAAFGMVSPGVVDTPMQEQIRRVDPAVLPASRELSQLYRKWANANLVVDWKNLEGKKE